MELVNNTSFASSSSREGDEDFLPESDSEDLSEGESGIFVTMAFNDAIINDPLVNQFKVDPLSLAVIDTPEFQRLRFIKQCGICDFVYPSAVHTRFEHSIGVYQWADKLMSQLGEKKNDPLTMCVKLAGLCHDLGHAPFSHLWERFLKRLGISWKHETQSAIMFKRLVENNDLTNKFLKAGLKPEHIELISSLILGNMEASVEGVNPEPFHYEIINNDETGIDVDKWDYIQRDSYFFGMKFTIDAYRVLNNMVLVGDSGKRHIAFVEKCADTILELFEFRCKLHRKCYQHRVCKNLEIMLLDALVAAKDHVFFDGEGRRVKLCEIHHERNVDIFLRANDSILLTILHSTNPELEQSKQIITRMVTRHLYSFVLEKVFPPALAQRFIREELSLEEFQNSVEQTLNDSKWTSAAKGEFRIAFVKLDMGKNKDPIEKVRFVQKDGSTVVKKMAYDVQPEFFQKSTVYGSLSLLVFTTKNKNEKLDSNIIKEIKHGVEEIIREQFEKY